MKKKQKSIHYILESILLICSTQKYLVWQDINIPVFWIIQMNPSTQLSTSPFYYTFHYKNAIDFFLYLHFSIHVPSHFLHFFSISMDIKWTIHEQNFNIYKCQPHPLLLSSHLTSPLLSLFPSPPHSLSPINTKQSFHILRWREKTTRKMTSVPEKSQRNGVKVRVRQRSWGEKVCRKEGGWERENEREHEERKKWKQVFLKKQNTVWTVSGVQFREEERKNYSLRQMVFLEQIYNIDINILLLISVWL